MGGGGSHRTKLSGLDAVGLLLLLLIFWVAMDGSLTDYDVSFSEKGPAHLEFVWHLV